MTLLNYKTSSDVAVFITSRIAEELAQGKKVLWLIPGGSSIPVAIEAAKVLSTSNHDGLMVSLTDERYGTVGHVDSNWTQLLAHGFDLPRALLVPVLKGESLAHTTAAWSAHLESLIREADYILGFFGIGADGHIAGMLPHTSALISKECATSYDAEKFQRITITPRVIDELDTAVAFTQGKSKWPTLAKLREDLHRGDHPVQLLKHVPEFTLFTDYQGPTLT
jgi:6-phosphogluconolactonase/glucosamine-6-phosphate isomerase/deaminase